MVPMAVVPTVGRLFQVVVDSTQPSEALTMLCESTELAAVSAVVLIRSVAPVSTLPEGAAGTLNRSRAIHDGSPSEIMVDDAPKFVVLRLAWTYVSATGVRERLTGGAGTTTSAAD